MNFSLIICTYMRPKTVVKLLQSVEKQSLYPNEILIIDGSTDAKTENILNHNLFKNLTYFKVDDSQRGLTKQRNFGIKKVDYNSEIVCFLDDDTVLEKEYFEKLIETYTTHLDAIAVGGTITNEVDWKQKSVKTANDEFEFDGFVRKIGQRNVLRKRFGLLSDKPPGIMPTFSNGFPISFLPPTGKIYEVESFMGGVSSYRKELFDKISFSTYFEGYGLYEDLDFCLRASKIGKLYVNTAARLGHYHEEAGRPNKYKYGKMVVRNGWYVWRVKYPKPTFKARFKWNAIVFLQISLRGINIFASPNRMEVFTEVVGRKIGWLSLLFNKPKVKK
ncbi:MAG: glycosyl transferase family 2 [Lutibacter sp.]|nr:MAG: glycosyl transferase family 2 [Lutibacter sp.]